MHAPVSETDCVAERVGVTDLEPLRLVLAEGEMDGDKLMLPDREGLVVRDVDSERVEEREVDTDADWEMEEDRERDGEREEVEVKEAEGVSVWGDACCSCAESIAKNIVSNSGWQRGSLDRPPRLPLISLISEFSAANC